VTAKDRGTGQEQKITISGSTALSDDEVEKMVKDAEAHADDDRKVKEAAEARNVADTLVYATEKTVKDLGDKVPAETKTDVESEVAAVKEALQGDDTDAIKAATEKLQAASYKLAEIVYADTQAESGETQGEAGDASAEPAEDEEVADYEVVDEDKK
jgi:molecular chaperone DnaK